MKNVKLILIGSIVFGVVSLFAKQSALTLTTKSYKEIHEVNKKGEKQIKYVQAAKVLPGDIVMYKNTVNNQDNIPAKNMVLKNPIPEHTHYVADSAKCQGKCKIVYSVDGGKTYDIASKLMKKDGSKMRLAKASEYTNVKWILQEALKPQQKTYVSFKTQLQ